MAITKIKKRYDINGYIVYADESEMTFCDYCGKPVILGMTDDLGDCHVHEECFDNYMNKTYGKGKWKPTEDREEDEYGGYYLFLNDKDEWEGTGIFYTEWYDNYEATWNYDINRKTSFDYSVTRDSESNIIYIMVYIGKDNEGNEMFKYFYNPTEDEIKWTVNE